MASTQLVAPRMAAKTTSRVLLQPLADASSMETIAATCHAPPQVSRVTAVHGFLANGALLGEGAAGNVGFAALLELCLVCGFSELAAQSVHGFAGFFFRLAILLIGLQLGGTSFCFGIAGLLFSGAGFLSSIMSSLCRHSDMLRRDASLPFRDTSLLFCDASLLFCDARSLLGGTKSLSHGANLLRSSHLRLPSRRNAFPSLLLNALRVRLSSPHMGIHILNRHLNRRTTEEALAQVPRATWLVKDARQVTWAWWESREDTTAGTSRASAGWCRRWGSCGLGYRGAALRW